MSAIRSLPSHPSLRHLKLEAKRRLAAGEFGTLHDAQAAIAREHGLPGWAALKQACVPEGYALTHVHWIIDRFRDAGQPDWTPPGEDELREHFDDRFLAAIPAGQLTETITGAAADLHGELTVISQAPLEAQVKLSGARYIAIVTPEPPHRLIGLRGFTLAERITDARLKETPPVRTTGRPPPGITALAAQARAELGLPALLLAGGEPGGPAWSPWVVASGHARLDRPEPLEPGHQFPVPGLTGLVTTTAVLRLAAEGRLDLDAPANQKLCTVRLADDSVTVRELLTHTGGVDGPTEFYADTVPGLAELMGPVISCGGPRGTIWPSNGGVCVLGQLVADVTGMPYARAAARLVLDPLGMRDSWFPASTQDIATARSAGGAITSYTVTPDGALEPFGAQVSTLQAAAGLWSTGADLVRLGTGWPSLLPAALAREALTPQTEPNSSGARIGLGLLLEGGTTAYGGAGLEAVTLLRARVRDHRTFVVLTSRAVTVDSLDASLRRAWLLPPEHKDIVMYQPYPGHETRLPETQRPPAPASVLTAVKAMYAGAAASLAGIVVDLLTVGASKDAIARHSPNMTAGQVGSTQHALIAGFIAGGVIAAVVWIVLAHFCKLGRGWARITGTVLFGLSTVDTLVGLTTPLALASRLWALVVWLAGLTAVVFLWRRASSTYFRPVAA